MTTSLSGPRRTLRLATAVSAVFGVGLCGSPGRAAASEGDNQCLVAYSAGQRSRNAGELREAQRAFTFCASNACPEALHPDCARWLDEVESAIPTAVFRVTTTQGVALDRVSVTIDGGPAELLDGRALSLDPGEHTLVFSCPGYESIERRFTFVEGEKLAQRSVALAALQARRPPAASAGSSAKVEAAAPGPRASLVPAWVAGGVGVAGVAGFVYFGTRAREDDRALDACAPYCSRARVDRVKRDYLLANVSLGTGAVGLLAATAWVLFRPSSSTPPGESRREALVLELGPVTSLTRRF